jgi:amidase
MPATSQSAFCPGERVTLEGARSGPLAGLRFAVKDLFDIAGHVTGGGNPDWARTHGPADATAPVVLQLVDAGATMIGKTLTDDLACGMFCENIHYGTPLNPRAPDRVPGGSSGGSAAAVATGEATFAIGTDTGGSMRVPAAFCGIYGIRPTHGRLSVSGVMPMAPTFDTIGWFAPNAATLERIGDVLLPAAVNAQANGLYVAKDAFAWAEPRMASALDAVLRRLPITGESSVFAPSPQHAVETFWPIMSRQLWNANGRWFRRERPKLAPGLAERFESASKVSAEQFNAASAERERLTRTLAERLAGDRVLVMPTTHDIAPLKGRPLPELDAYRLRTVALISIASLARLPQISIPAAEAAGCPVGLSIVGASGTDRMLMATARAIAARLGIQ